VFRDPLVATLAEFVRSVGINVLPASSLLTTNFPGLDIQHGAVLVDESRVVYPGDILHEAGHVAMTEPSERSSLRLTPTGGQEMATMAWSYAATIHLKMDPSLVFYPASYDNFGLGLVEIFGAGKYIGVPLLQRYGMAVEPKNAGARNAPPFPHMLKWLR
jgi:hypothetical protein